MTVRVLPRFDSVIVSEELSIRLHAAKPSPHLNSADERLSNRKTIYYSLQCITLSHTTFDGSLAVGMYIRSRSYVYIYPSERAPCTMLWQPSTK